MTPQEWQRVRPILESALELDPARRSSFLDQACADRTLRNEVESLIASHQQAGTDLLNPAFSPALNLDEETRFRLPPGKRIGAYEILEEIAVGGMGAVYRAVRADGQYKQQVALKIVRSELGAEFTTSRFRNERQILASLDHPNIARILDGGTTAESVPYLVMELVEGQRIDNYCDDHKLTTTERLNLFLQICSAVQYAHQHLIIHRDIKPGNIMVNAERVPKLLDFGIAKILESGEANEKQEQTISLVRLLTPEYASPEQIKGEPITTASDVYSLGVVLYELLTGCAPYTVPTHTPHEISRAVCEAEPEKPSEMVLRQKPSANEGESRPADVLSLASPREGSPEKLSKRLRGDLDNIVLMALRKEPRRRYASVEQFAQDIRRHLDHLPVFARQDTAAYRASKFVARHKVGVAVSALVAVALLSATGITLRQARIARSERVRAERRFNDVRQLASSLIFDIHDSIRDLPGSTPARKLIVDHALQYLDSLSQESRDDLSLQRELATAYERVGLVQGHYLQNNLGDTQGSLTSYRKALKIREQIKVRSSDWNDSLTLAGCYRLVAHQQWAMGDYSGAVKNVVSAIDTSESLNKVHPKDLKVLTELRVDYQTAGQVESGDYAGSVGDPERVKDNNRKALQVDEALLAIASDDPGIQHAYANDLNNLGGTLDDDPKAALECYYKQLEIEQKLYKRSPEARYARGIAHAYSHIAQTYDTMGDQSRSLENNMRGLEVSEELVRLDPKNTYFRQALAISYANTADDLSKTGQKIKSLEYIDNGLRIMRPLVASDPENRQQRGYLAVMVRMKGSNFMKAGKPEAARREFAEALSLFESLHELDPTEAEGALTDVAACKEKLAEATSRLDNSKLATEYFHQVLNFVEPALSKQEPELNVLYLAADSYSGLGDLQLQKAQRSLKNSAEQRKSWILTRSWYLKSLAVWHQIEHHPHHSAPKDFDVGDPATVTKKLQLCEANLSTSN